MTTPTDMLDILSCIPGLYAWVYDGSRTLLYTTCPTRDASVLFDRLFSECDYHARIHAYAKDHSAPYALSIYMGLVWYAVLEKTDETLTKIYLLGPAFQYPVSLKQLEQTLAKYEEQGMNFRSKRQLLNAMEQLPVIPHTQLASYAMMLHYCITGKRIMYQDLHFLQDTLPDSRHEQTSGTSLCPLEDFYAGTAGEFDQKSVKITPSTYKAIWDTETELVQSLRLDFSPGQDSRTHHTRSFPAQKSRTSNAHSFPGWNPQTHRLDLLPTDASGIQTPVGKLKTSAVIMVSLCARTAVEAGLTYEEAYRLADEYLGKIENEPHSPVGLQNLMGEIPKVFHEHIQKRCHEAHTYSREVTLCMDYVRNHVTQAVKLDELARLTGYAPYYLSRKFKEETGHPLREYIRTKKMEYAAFLLATTDDGIQDIMEKIGLSSRSHFSQDFQAVMGMSPAAYRTANKK